MNTASVKSRENEKLKEQIGNSKTYKQVTAIPWLSEIFNLQGTTYVYNVLGTQLAKLSEKLGYDVKRIPHTEYDHVNAYHVAVIEELYKKLKQDRNMMRKYRR
jgi:hypothetical protein